MYTTGRINTEQDRKFTYSIILWHVRVTVFAVGEKYVLHITNVCVCVCVCIALVIQHVKRMRRIVLSFLTRLALPYFLLHLTNGTIFGRKKIYIEHKMCVVISSTSLPEIFLILKLTQRDITINVLYIGLHVQYPLFFLDVNDA